MKTWSQQFVETMKQVIPKTDSDVVLNCEEVENHRTELRIPVVADVGDEEGESIGHDAGDSSGNQLKTQSVDDSFVSEAGEHKNLQLMKREDPRPNLQVRGQLLGDKVNSLPKSGFSYPRLANNSAVGIISANEISFFIADKVFDKNSKRDLDQLKQIIEVNMEHESKVFDIKLESGTNHQNEIKRDGVAIEGVFDPGGKMINRFGCKKKNDMHKPLSSIVDHEYCMMYPSAMDYSGLWVSSCSSELVFMTVQKYFVDEVKRQQYRTSYIQGLRYEFDECDYIQSAESNVVYDPGWLWEDFIKILRAVFELRGMELRFWLGVYANAWVNFSKINTCSCIQTLKRMKIECSGLIMLFNNVSCQALDSCMRAETWKWNERDVVTGDIAYDFGVHIYFKKEKEKKYTHHRLQENEIFMDWGNNGDVMRLSFQDLNQQVGYMLNTKKFGDIIFVSGSLYSCVISVKIKLLVYVSQYVTLPVVNVLETEVVQEVGYIFLLVGQGDFHGEAMHKLKYVVNQSYYIMQTPRYVTSLMSLAKTINIAKLFFPLNVKCDFYKLKAGLNTASEIMWEKNENLGDIEVDSNAGQSMGCSPSLKRKIQLLEKSYQSSKLGSFPGITVIAKDVDFIGGNSNGKQFVNGANAISIMGASYAVFIPLLDNLQIKSFLSLSSSIAWYLTIASFLRSMLKRCNIWTIISQGQQHSHLEDKVGFEGWVI